MSTSQPSFLATGLLAIALGLIASTPARAHEDAHEHGTGALDVALDNGVLELLLEAPGDNFVGFEHAPRNAKETAAVRAAEQRLRKPEALFALPAAAGCTRRSVEVTPPKATKGGGKHDHHAEWSASYAFACKAPDALRTIDLGGLFKAFPNTTRLRAQVAGPKGQTGRTLTPKAPRLPLR